jgi:hypothetical protein
MTYRVLVCKWADPTNSGKAHIRAFPLNLDWEGKLSSREPALFDSAEEASGARALLMMQQRHLRECECLVVDNGEENGE